MLFTNSNVSISAIKSIQLFCLYLFLSINHSITFHLIFTINDI